MIEAEKPAFFTALFALASTMGVEADEPMGLGYWLGMRDLSLQECEQAIEHAIRQSRFMPKPAELRALAGRDTPAGSALRAWMALQRAVSQHGAWASVDFEDKTINACVRVLGGWRQLCTQDADEFTKWTAQRFLKEYETLSRVRLSDEQLAPLVGHHQIANQSVPEEIRPALEVKLIATRPTKRKALPAPKPKSWPEPSDEEQAANKTKARDLIDSTLGKVSNV